MKGRSNLFACGILILAAIFANSFSAPSCKLIQFDDIKPGGFGLDQCWSGIGMDHNQNVYIGISHVCTYGEYDPRDDVAMFKYNARTGQRQFLNTLKGISAASGNLGPNQYWSAGEGIAKIHSPIWEYNGKMYFSSHDYHGLQADYNDTIVHRGGHFYSYDLASGQFDDLSKTDSYGVSVRYQGIITMNVLRSHNKLAGYTFPWGDILVYDLTQRKTAIYTAPAEYRKLGNLCSREIIATDKGKVFFSYYNPNPADNGASPLWELDINTGVIRKTANVLRDGFVNGMVETHDRRFVYFNNIDGYMYAFNTETETLEHLGSCAPDNEIAQGYSPDYLLSFSMSLDQTKLYSLVVGWKTALGIPYSLYEYDIKTKSKRYICNFNDVLDGSTITGNGVTDSLGRIYFARLGGSATCGLIQITLDQQPGIQLAAKPNVSSQTLGNGPGTISISDVLGRRLFGSTRAFLGAGNFPYSKSAPSSPYFVSKSISGHRKTAKVVTAK